ncbi:hypothetical protein TVAG_059870 [Trichomonas vaginalis G3]|uniref:Auxin Efflux Carrier family protein n=1 Tax=Trichomonas vaginalis (strain ATCC PRA-98 / G3) TaxID=412133 RepID=A2FHZ0_TRIV3|nr:intracellular auxin transport [Trichomonas vaginalis G3]EAX95463.1 hypothetical protein TVAG_059870 [Trichomonas vaginalis G3]KAI5537590.1 intracellular auxin transport [Trichomonas vaginalis G3]|eukprot:XP_001308393.1 hypothetical protein [Trichomonas vaginalis G3]
MSASIYIALTPIMIYPFKSRIGTYLATSFPAAYVNYVVSGIPVFNSIWPAKENMMVSMTTISNHIVSSPIFYILVGIYKIIENNKKLREEGMPPEKFSFKILVNLVISIFKSPILISVLCGIAYSATGLTYVPFLDKLMQIAGDMVYANALLCVGIFLAQHSLIACNWLQFIFCMFSRFMIGPFFALLWCKALKLSNRLSRQCVIICAQPTAVASYAITCSNKLGEGVASTMIFWTSILLVPFMVLYTR